MEQTFQVVTWNCRRASSKSRAWDYLLELHPDVALLQDFGNIPESVSRVYSYVRDITVSETGRSQPSAAGALVKGTADADVPLPAPNEWVARELAILNENFISKAVTLHNGYLLNVLSAYSPAWPVDPARLQGIDTTGIQLTHNRKVWGTEILWASLRAMNLKADERLIVGGDFNSAESFDLGRKGPTGNREVRERMNGLGLQDCLRTFKGALTPTFRNPRGGEIMHQIDHQYVTPALLDTLRWRDVGSPDRVFRSVPTWRIFSDRLSMCARRASVEEAVTGFGVATLLVDAASLRGEHNRVEHTFPMH